MNKKGLCSYITLKSVDKIEANQFNLPDLRHSPLIDLT